MVRKADMPTKLTTEIITAAILGFEEQKRDIGSVLAGSLAAGLGLYTAGFFNAPLARIRAANPRIKRVSQFHVAISQANQAIPNVPLLRTAVIHILSRAPAVQSRLNSCPFDAIIGA